MGCIDCGFLGFVPKIYMAVFMYAGAVSPLCLTSTTTLNASPMDFQQTLYNRVNLSVPGAAFKFVLVRFPVLPSYQAEYQTYHFLQE